LLDQLTSIQGGKIKKKGGSGRCSSGCSRLGKKKREKIKCSGASPGKKEKGGSYGLSPIHLLEGGRGEGVEVAQFTLASFVQQERRAGQTFVVL